jgi:peptidoglycan hydrolase CwlO-like protein
MVEPTWIALIISGLGFLASVYYSNKNSRKTDMDEVIKRTEVNTKISTKLDGIASDVKETAKNVDRLREDIAEHGSRITAVEQSVKSAHHRIDTVEKHIGYGAEHRERSRDEE